MAPESAISVICVCDSSFLLQIDNKQCILAEFSNENGLIQTGYMAWVQNKDVLNIKRIIKNNEEIIVYWPDIDVAEASVMKCKLKKAVFKKHPVKILSCGGNHSINKRMSI